MYLGSHIGSVSKVISRFLVVVFLSVTLLPALALAATIILPATPTQNLGTPPQAHLGELFDGAPSHFGQVLDEDRYFNNYTLSLTSGNAYSITLSDFEFDLFFLVTDMSGNILANSSDAHVSGVSLELRVIAPATGTYHVVVSSVSGEEVGEYKLTITPLPNFAQITGTVRNTALAPLEDILVTAYKQVTIAGDTHYFPELTTTTDVSGTFSLSPLIAGIYKVSFRDFNLSYSSLYYAHAQVLENATLINLSSGETHTLTDTTLTQAATITGTVTNENSAALADITVSAYIEYESDLFFSVASTYSDASGNYALTGLEADTYFVKFSCSDGLYLTKYYDQVSTTGAASPLTVALATTTPNINAELKPAARIAGNVTDNTNAPVEDIVAGNLGTTIGGMALDSVRVGNRIDVRVTASRQGGSGPVTVSVSTSNAPIGESGIVRVRTDASLSFRSSQNGGFGWDNHSRGSAQVTWQGMFTGSPTRTSTISRAGITHVNVNFTLSVNNGSNLAVLVVQVP